MEKFRINGRHAFILCVLVSFLFSCSSGFLKVKDDKEIFKNEEFEKKVSIKTVESSATAVGGENNPSLAASTSSSDSTKGTTKATTEAELKKVNTKEKKDSKKSTKKDAGLSAQAKSSEVGRPLKRMPELEDSEGFDGKRRPLVDPFKVGEKVIHTVSYFGTPAGVLTLSVNPFVEVNGKKSYNFMTEIKSSRLFSQFYSVEDSVETFVDFENLVPHVFKLHIKESGQLKEAQSFFDHEKLKADYWESKFTKKNGHEEKKLNWDILPYSQNAFSAIFYMRVFKWSVGKEYAFQVSDDEKNVIFKGRAIQKEKIKTDAGEFNAIKIKAEIAARGALSQTGDLYFWISDDDRKFILKIEAKIKIGTLISEVTEIENK